MAVTRWLARWCGQVGVNRRAAGIALVVALLASAACLGTPRHDDRGAALALSAQAMLDPQVVTQRPYWLMYDQPGWCSAHEANYDWPRAALAVRLALFRDPAAATAAFARLSPSYVYGLYRERMAGVPEPVTDPPELSGDDAAMTVYRASVPLHVRRTTGFTSLPVLVTSVRSGRALFLIESIGMEPDAVAAAVQALTTAAERAEMVGC